MLARTYASSHEVRRAAGAKIEFQQRQFTGRLLRSPTHKPVPLPTGVYVGAHNIPSRVDAERLCRDGPRRIDRGVPVAASQKAVKTAGGIPVLPHDQPGRTDVPAVCGKAAGNIEWFKVAVDDQVPMRAAT